MYPPGVVAAAWPGVPGRPCRCAAIRQVATDAEFTGFRRAAETPFNIVYEVRP